MADHPTWNMTIDDTSPMFGYSPYGVRHTPRNTVAYNVVQWVNYNILILGYRTWSETQDKSIPSIDAPAPFYQAKLGAFLEFYGEGVMIEGALNWGHWLMSPKEISSRKLLNIIIVYGSRARQRTLTGSSGSTARIRSIVGAALGGTVFLILVVVAAIVWFKRQNRRREFYLQRDVSLEEIDEPRCMNQPPPGYVSQPFIPPAKMMGTAPPIVQLVQRRTKGSPMLIADRAQPAPDVHA
ncbi:hypothetical protein B0J17DRAFT_631464 [Rhizoctonia solani]|nr:hypothetical protein B0J17DRAFT_631464 [Rhizoctonia solani]